MDEFDSEPFFMIVILPMLMGTYAYWGLAVNHNGSVAHCQLAMCIVGLAFLGIGFWYSSLQLVMPESEGE